MDFPNDRRFAGMTDALGDFAHVEQLFSTGPAVEKVIGF